MDQRQTFNNDKELLSLVTSISTDGLKAFLIIDNGGLTRVEGMITSINHGTDSENAGITIDSKDTVLLKQVVGINGLFRSDYSEC